MPGSQLRRSPGRRLVVTVAAAAVGYAATIDACQLQVHPITEADKD